MKCTDCKHIKGILRNHTGACWANPNKRRKVVIIRDITKERDCTLFVSNLLNIPINRERIIEEFNPDEEYNRTILRSHMIDSILSLDKTRFTREYLNTLTTDALEDLEDSLLCTCYETP